MPAKGAISVSRTPRYDVVVVGAGVIGLVTAWRTAQRGLGVAVADPAPASGTTHVSAGMLTPVTEAAYGEEELLTFTLASHRRWPAFAAELERTTGLPSGYRARGTLEVAFDGDDMAVLDELLEFRRGLGLEVERLTGREIRRLEPMLAPSVRGGLHAPDDGSADPRLLTRALMAASEQAGVAFVRRRVVEVTTEAGTATGVRLAAGGQDTGLTGNGDTARPEPDTGEELAAEKVVLAAGVGTAALAGLPVRAVKGQILRLRTPVEFVTRTIRGLVRGTPVYVVPRDDGEIALGATQEDLADTRVTAGGVWQLLRDAHDLLPGITELELAETAAGLRPCAPDNFPVLGASSIPGLYAATGHFRHGVLLAPATGEVMAEALVTGRLPESAACFAADRFPIRQEERTCG
ncbi:MAG: glycine oxidase ThiO [Streptosporangiales bacterium]|nr:glycine oxidase ThiO [Streptosporangiales bacterium]